jgi:hypothetical protein
MHQHRPQGAVLKFFGILHYRHSLLEEESEEERSQTVALPKENSNR